MIIPTVISKLPRLELSWKILLLKLRNKSNVCLDFDFHSRKSETNQQSLAKPYRPAKSQTDQTKGPRHTTPSPPHRPARLGLRRHPKRAQDPQKGNTQTPDSGTEHSETNQRTAASDGPSPHPLRYQI